MKNFLIHLFASEAFPEPETSNVLLFLGDGQYIKSKIFADRCEIDSSKNSIRFYLKGDLIAIFPKDKTIVSKPELP